VEERYLKSGRADTMMTVRRRLRLSLLGPLSASVAGVTHHQWLERMVIDRGEPITGLVGLLDSVLMVPTPRGYSELPNRCESGAEHGVSRCHTAHMSLRYLDAALRRL